MEHHIFFLMLLFVASGHLIQDPSLDDHWEAWKESYQKTYKDKGYELSRRLIWEKNFHMIEEHNLKFSKGQSTFEMGINHLGDMTNEEINSMLNRFRIPDDNRNNFTDAKYTEPSDYQSSRGVNWVKKGYVTNVRDQGHCGSCWAFSATGALEGLLKKTTGKLVELSPQNLMDCSTDFGNHGCNGGYITRAFKYVMSNNGIDSEKSYPYKHKEGRCRYHLSGRAATCNSYKTIPWGSEKALQRAVASVGPVSVCIDASQSSFHYYKKGIYYEPLCSSQKINHAVLLVGYDNENDFDYWLVKNSWGTDWGNQGYIQMIRNRNNNCGISCLASYPTM
ncbi:procathepsin L-like [Polypterus senegalus]|uniref:procathepsin L-like n=1 Tax=Polypterus senegalus TaxID=55291 RepID=UPI001965E9B5|nr:procathepsin L-like [Polypterus senegalus]